MGAVSAKLIFFLSGLMCFIIDTTEPVTDEHTYNNASLVDDGLEDDDNSEYQEQDTYESASVELAGKDSHVPTEARVSRTQMLDICGHLNKKKTAPMMIRGQ